MHPADDDRLAVAFGTGENVLRQPRVVSGEKRRPDGQLELLRQRFQGFAWPTAVAAVGDQRSEQDGGPPAIGHRRVGGEERDQRLRALPALLGQVNVGLIGRFLCVPEENHLRWPRARAGS